VRPASERRERQVTVIARERWDELMRDLGADLPPAALAEVNNTDEDGRGAS